MRYKKKNQSRDQKKKNLKTKKIKNVKKLGPALEKNLAYDNHLGS
jgi:hypothetical protein